MEETTCSHLYSAACTRPVRKHHRTPMPSKKSNKTKKNLTITSIKSTVVRLQKLSSLLIAKLQRVPFPTSRAREKQVHPRKCVRILLLLQSCSKVNLHRSVSVKILWVYQLQSMHVHRYHLLKQITFTIDESQRVQ